MRLIKNTIVFLDTGFLKNHKPIDKSYDDFFQYSKDEKITLCTSYICIEEWRTQKVSRINGYVQKTTDEFINLRRTEIIAKGILEPDALKNIPDKTKIEQESKKLVEYFLEENKIAILLPTEGHINATWDAYFNGSPPFKQPKSRDDIPDAWVFESARDVLREEEFKELQNRFCICGDRNLDDALKSLGFKSITLLKLLELLQNEIQASTSTIEQQATPVATNVLSRETTEGSEASKFDNLDNVLSTAMSPEIKEIYLRVLGFTHWLNYPSKENLIAAIATSGFESKLIGACAVLLSQEPLALIRDTGNHYLPMNKEVCKEAANRVMPEILKMLDQG